MSYNKRILLPGTLKERLESGKQILWEVECYNLLDEMLELLLKQQSLLMEVDLLKHILKIERYINGI